MHTPDPHMRILIQYPIGSVSSRCVGFSSSTAAKIKRDRALRGSTPFKELKDLFQRGTCGSSGKYIFHENRETVQAKHQVVKWDNPFFCAQAQCGHSQRERKVKNTTW